MLRALLVLVTVLPCVSSCYVEERRRPVYVEPRHERREERKEERHEEHREHEDHEH